MKDENFKIGLLNDIKGFSFDTIIDDLPELLQYPASKLVEETEKEVFLMGLLGVVSGLLPNIKGLYAGKWIAPNLYVYVLAGYGGGKGGLDYAKELGMQIHSDKKEKANELMSVYLKEMEEYKRKLKFYYRDKNPPATPPGKPKKPPISIIFIPANNSKSGIYQLVEENKGRGILFESEGDTLAVAIKQDFGNFSDTLRKAFHHESLELFRRLNNELIEIKNPELSVVISSTFDQLKYLIPSVENGLYSRFLYYELKQDNRFTDVFDDKKKEYKEFFKVAGAKFKILYDFLSKKEEPVYFWLTKSQQKIFVDRFNEKKAAMIKEVDSTMAGTANRLGIIAFRIMMLLTALRCYSKGELNSTIICYDLDFENSLRIIERLEKHAKTVYSYLNKENDKKGLAFQLHSAGIPIRDIEKVTKINRGTLSKWFNKNN